ncbi:unnamed protein product [Brugia pahangi]|uniref:DUF362 domain-containing protein n=1 Tax=Brugia pahangi TaxID=6280 RepID=A0A0N4SYW8_BRUPA|nr:unnamed protein product [Brugia pahangi]
MEENCGVHIKKFVKEKYYYEPDIYVKIDVRGESYLPTTSLMAIKNYLFIVLNISKKLFIDARFLKYPFLPLAHGTKDKKI